MRPMPAATTGTMPGAPQMVLITMLSALLVTLAFPPVGVGGLAWIGLIPLLTVLGQVRPAAGFLHGLLFGALFMGAATQFIGQFGALPWLALTLVMGLYYGVFGLVASLMCRTAQPIPRVLGLAGAWTLLEIIRGNAGPLAFTFGDLGYSQHALLAIAQLATVLGHYGVTFLVVMMNAGLATVLLAMFPRFWYRPGHPLLFNRYAGRMALACYGLVFLVYIWGSIVVRLGQSVEQQHLQTGKALTVAAAQAALVIGNSITSEDVAASASKYDELSRLKQPADLIVWPETALPTILRDAPDLQQRLRDIARRERAQLLVGAVESENEAATQVYNTAFLVTPEGQITSAYRKQDLVMFGEYVPMRGRWKLLERYPVRLKDFTPGSGRKLVDIKGWRVAPLICYEGTFPGPAREITALGADIIAIMTSDLWAVATSEPEMHSLTAPFRAIETRRYLVRSASNGLTAIYDPYGDARAKVGYRTPGVATLRIPQVERRQTAHQRYGDAPLILACALLVVMGLLARSVGPDPTLAERG